MKLFVWNEAEGVSHSEHDEGGIVAIAATLERARELFHQAGAKPNCSALTTEPDLTRECDGEEYIAIHPDAGCC